MHLSERTLHAWLDGELPAREVEAARGHLGRCEACRGRFAVAQQERQEVAWRLRALDEPAPARSAAAIVARARLQPAPPARARLAWAAGVAMATLVAVGLAYAIPGSPLKAWVASLAHRDGGPQAPKPPELAREAEDAGVSVAPGERLVISFARERSGASARVTWTGGAEVEVRAPRDAAAFDSGADTLRIDDRAAAAFEISLPRRAPHVEIVVQGRRIFLSEAGRVTAAGASSAGSWLLPLSR